MYPKILLFGDSITEFGTRPGGIIPLLINAYTRKADVYHRGLSGYNTAMALPYLEPFLNETVGEIIAVLIFFGTNDACIPGHKQHVPQEEYRANLREMVRLAHTRTDLVILMGPAVVEETPLRSNRRSVEYAIAARQVAEEHGAEFIDLYAAFRAANGELAGQLVPDGVHFSQRGYEIWYQHVLRALERADRGPESLGYVIPAYRQVLGLPQ